MRKAVLSYQEYSINEQTDVYVTLGKLQDEYDAINTTIRDLWKDVNVIGGTGINKVGVQTNIKKKIANEYKKLGDKMIVLADAEFNKAKYEENKKQIEKQEELTNQAQGQNQPTA